jgi:hypothetical protein
LYDRKDEARDKFLDMDKYVRNKEKEITEMETRLNQLKQEHEPYKAQEELNNIHNYFPTMKEQMRVAGLCEQVGLVFDSIRALLFGKTLSGDSAKFYSPEHKQYFEAKDIQLKIEKDPDNPGKLRLSLNGQNILDWFKQKYQEVKQATNYYKRPGIKSEEGKGKGIKR